jgi:sulfoxide reductase heme-binding subunit YedZ
LIAIPQVVVAVLRKAMLHRSAKPLLGLLSALPLMWLMWGAAHDGLGANPAEYVIRATGDWALRFLCLTLAVTPMRVTLGAPELARFRRMSGLWTYGYVMLHALSYSGFDMGFEWPDIVHDIAKRPFIWLGFSAFVLLTPLALTSFNRAIRWLGAKRWQSLHRAVYAVAVLAVLHFYWMRAGKHNFTEVYVYAAVLSALLVWRIVRRVAAHSTNQ